MLDPIQLPILMKAIDFVFEEGRKILEERRERRKSNEAASTSKDQEEPALPEPEKAQEIKQGLLTSKVDESLWQNHEAEVKHLVKLLETHTRNYHLAGEQYAKWGSALVPPIIMHNLTDAENSIAATLQQLEIVLSKVYKKDINPNK